MANLYGYRESFGNVVTLATDQIVQGTKRFRSFDNNYNGNLVDVQTIVCKGQCDVVGNLIAQNNMNVNGTLSVSGNETVTGVLTATNAGSRVTLANKIVTEGRDDAVQYYIPFVASKDNAPNGQTLFTDNGATGAHLGFTPSTNTLAIGNSAGANGKIEVVGTSSSLTIAGTGTALSVSGTATIAGAGTALNLSAGGLTVAGSIQTSTGITLPTTIPASVASGNLGYFISLATNSNASMPSNSGLTVSALHFVPAGTYIAILNTNFNTSAAVAGNLQYTSMGLSTVTNSYTGGTGEVYCGSTVSIGVINPSFVSSGVAHLLVPTSGANYYIVARAVYTGFTIVHNSAANIKLIRIA